MRTKSYYAVIRVHMPIYNFTIGIYKRYLRGHKSFCIPLDSIENYCYYNGAPQDDLCADAGSSLLNSKFNGYLCTILRANAWPAFTIIMCLMVISWYR